MSVSAAKAIGREAQLVEGLRVVLRQVDAAIAGLSAEQYTRAMGPLFANASVGAHVRHCLDHLRALLETPAGVPIEYDHRERGTAIEREPGAGRAEIARLIGVLDASAGRAMDEELVVRLLPSAEAAEMSLSTTLGRELAFILSHTIHHNASVRGMLVAMDKSVEAGLGMAPATIAGRGSCAR